MINYLYNTSAIRGGLYRHYFYPRDISIFKKAIYKHVSDVGTTSFDVVISPGEGGGGEFLYTFLLIDNDKFMALTNFSRKRNNNSYELEISKMMDIDKIISQKENVYGFFIVLISYRYTAILGFRTISRLSINYLAD